MSVHRLRLLSVGVATTVIVSIAAPAQADHAAEIPLDGSWCFLGAWTSPVAMHLYTENKKDIKLRIRKDGSARYVCTFRGVPKFLAADDPRNVWESDWRLPERRTVSRDVYCWRPGEEASGGDATEPRSKIEVRPNGIVKLTCITNGNYGS